MPKKSASTIVRTVSVENLFEYLNYSIDFQTGGEADPNINLLYGENGSGKTTLLRLIYASLSPSTTEGLRGYIATVPFKRFRVETSLGITVEISRENSDKGPYRYAISGDQEISVDIKPEPDRRVTGPALLRLLPLLPGRRLPPQHRLEKLSGYSCFSAASAWTASM